jgi:hypothetical protein
MNAISTRLSAISGAYFVATVLVGSGGPDRTKAGLLVSSTTGASADLLADLTEATFIASTLFFGLFLLSAAAGTLGVLTVDSYLPLPYVTGLVWVGVVSVLLAVRRSRATGAEPEVVTGRADAVGRM